VTGPPSGGGRLPSLGRRGEGWVAGQVGVLALIAAAGLFGPRWPDGSWPWTTCAAALAGIPGLALGIAAALALGRQLTPLPAPAQEGQLRERGAYALCRHPMYGGVLLLAVAWALATSPLALATAALAAAFLALKSRVEERWLAARHPGYEEYRRRVRRRMIPYVW
jgi:protein-S-isoprenylcysteine O-methyltransferase Ste14